MSDNTFWTVIVCSVVTMIASIAITAIVVDGYRDCQYIKVGYTRKTLQGHDWPQWVKEEAPVRRDECVPGLDPRNWAAPIQAVPLKAEVR